MEENDLVSGRRRLAATQQTVDRRKCCGASAAPRWAPARWAVLTRSAAANAAAPPAPPTHHAPPVVGTYWQEGGEVFNVRAYGATGDGSTDDTKAIAATIAAARAGVSCSCPRART